MKMVREKIIADVLFTREIILRGVGKKVTGL
jgi:hypothetical protein